MPGPYRASEMSKLRRMFPGAYIVPLQLGQQLVLAALQKQLLAVLLKALAVILSQKRGRVGTKGQLVDKDDHLLPVLKRLLHKVKGKFQRVRGGGNSLLAALHLTVEAAAHRVERIVRVQPVVKLAAPRCQQGNGAGAGGGLIGQQAAGTLVGFQPLAVAVALLGKQVGGVRPRPAGPAPA